MFPILNIGPAVVPTAPLLLILGLYVALSVVEQAAKSLGLAAVRTYEVATNGILAGFLIARLWFVVANLESFLANPVSIVWPLTSGYNLLAGVIGGAVMLVLLGRRHSLPLRPTLLALLPGVLTLLLFVSLGDFVARAGVGTVTTLPWGIERAGIARHPVGAYEMVLALGALVAWWRLSRSNPPAAFWLTVGGYSFGRFFLDAFRTNSLALSSGHHIAQLLLLPLAIFCAYQLSSHSEQPVSTIE